MNKKLLGFGLAVGLLASSVPASADIIGFGADNGSGLSAEAYFEVNGTTLTITLINTGDAASVPADVLNGIFFTLAGDPALTPVSAIVPAGSSVIYAPASQAVYGATNVSPEWAYDSDGSPGPGQQSIGSAGWGVFGPSNRFDTSTTLQGPASVGGMEYGIVNGIAGDANAPLSGPNAFVNNTVIFTLTGLPQGFTILDVSDVIFQYGTSLTEPSLTGDCITCDPCPDCPTPNDPVAEPATLALFGLGLAGLAKRAKSKH